MKNLRKMMIVLLLAVVAVAQAQMMPAVPADPAIRMGKLDNGLTYYIRHNEHPEHVANFYIAQRVGSIQEEENQRGLAHFLEHMAFNGSVNFPGNGIIDYTRSLGVAFGRDLNAYTSIEQTVYNINNVPTARVESLDSCLLILKDWSNGLLLQPEEIDKERGVVHGEWAMRNSATQRLFEKSLPLLYPGNKYGERMPIGLMSVIDNFTPDALRSYYEKWYHPENQAIIVVGDIDVDRTEAKIKEMFAGIKAGPDAAHVVPLPVEDNEQAIYVSDHDKEMPYSIYMMYMKSDPMPEEMKGTMAEIMQDYMVGLVTSMFNSRMQEISQQPDCPFNQLSLGYGNYLLSSTKDAFEVECVAKEGKEKETLAAAVREVLRAKQFGFTGSEFVRAKEEYLSAAEKAYTNRDKRTSEELYSQMVNNYLKKTAMPDAETKFQMIQMLAQQIPLELINQMVAESITINEDKNFVCMLLSQEKEGVKNLTTDELAATVAAVRGETLEAWVDNAKDEPLLSKMPKAGKIVKETENKALGFKQLTLSNGAKVILKKTDFKDNEVLLTAMAAGGNNMYGEADYANLKLFDVAVESAGLGNFNNNELSKALAGKQVGLSLGLNGTNSMVSGHSTPKDLETMMQLLYLHFTDLKKDEKAAAAQVSTLETVLKNRDLQPETALSDTLSNALYSYNPRYAPLTLDVLKKFNLDRTIAIAKERFATANNFTFTFVGNFDEEALRQYICQYIASLPGKGKEGKKNNVLTFFKGDIKKDFTRKMETPKPNIMQVYYADLANTMENDVKMDFATKVLSMMLLQTVREDAGAAYSVGAYGNISATYDLSRAVMQVYAPISVPEKTDLALDLINKGVAQLAEAADADMVAKVKADMLKQADINAKENSYWTAVIEQYNLFGLDFHTNYKKTIEAITPADVAAFVKNNILKSGNRLTVVMRPQE